MHQTAHKAIAAMLASAVSLVAIFVPGVDQLVSPEIVSAVAAIVTPLLVYFVPNKQVR